MTQQIESNNNNDNNNDNGSLITAQAKCEELNGKVPDKWDQIKQNKLLNMKLRRLAITTLKQQLGCPFLIDIDTDFESPSTLKMKYPIGLKDKILK